MTAATRHSAARQPASRSELRIRLSPRDIPPLPSAMVDILKLANDPDASVAALERGIARDQTLTLRVLTIANSSFYGCSRQIVSVRGAIALLGTRQIQSIASTLALAPALKSDAGPQLWVHALACALWTRAIARQSGVPELPSVFTAALMHDLGIVVLLRKAPAELAQCLRLVRESGRPFHQVERELLGTDHADLAARACEMWKLPASVTRMIANHHEPDSCDTESCILAAADMLSAMTGMAEFEWMALDPPAPGVTVPHFLAGLDISALLAKRDRIAAEAESFA